MQPVPKPALVAGWQLRRDALANPEEALQRLSLSWHYATMRGE